MKDLIVLVEDERSIADTVLYALEKEGYATEWCTTAQTGLTFIQKSQPSLAIFDIGLPDQTGLELCKQVRDFSQIPIIFLTARTEELDRVLGLELGGDDYITKPFSPRELVARVRSVLRRHNLSHASAPPLEEQSSNPPHVIGDFEHKKEERRVLFQQQDLELSTHEYKLLTLLFSRPKRVYSREEILQLAWDEPEMVIDRTIDAHVKSIRKKIKLIDSSADPIRTVRGVGYSFELENK